MRSRLKENINKQNKKTLLGIIAIVILVGFFGMKSLIGFSEILEKIKNPKDTVTGIQSLNYVAPPIIDQMEESTNSAKTIISGFSSMRDGIVSLYIKNDKVAYTKVETDGKFLFENIQLSPGENKIKVKAENDNIVSDFSQITTIQYINKMPLLEISFPGNEQKFKKDDSPIKISGKSDQGAKVTVNSFWAISNDDGSFYYIYNLKDGDNNLKIISIDSAGNKAEKEVKFKVE